MKYFAGTAVVPTLSRLVLALAFITAGYNKLFNEWKFTDQDAQTLQAVGVDLDRRPAEYEEEQEELQASRLVVPVAFIQDDPAPVDDPVQDQPTEPPAEEEPTDPLQDEPQEEPLEEPLPPDVEDDDVEDADEVDQPAGEIDADDVPAADEDEYVYYGKQLHFVTLLVARADWPQPEMLAWVAAMTEFFGGICLLIGFLSRFWALGLSIAMASAFYLASWSVDHVWTFADDPFDFANPENIPLYNQVLAQLGLFILAFGIVLTGPGPLSLDRALFGRRHKEEVVVRAD